MARRERKKLTDECALPMTPMIDVVFQLLIFFLFTIKPEDIVAHLGINRPSPDPNAKPEQKIEDMVSITIFADGITLNGKLVSMETLDATLMKLSRLSKTQTIMIKCAPDSPHDKLVKVLDLCCKANLSNLTVFSL